MGDPQDQDHFPDSMAPQDHPLLHRGNSEAPDVWVHGHRHRDGAVAVAVRLHHCRHLGARTGHSLNLPHIKGDAVQIHLHHRISHYLIQNRDFHVIHTFFPSCG